MLLTSWSYNF